MGKYSINASQLPIHMDYIAQLIIFKIKKQLECFN